MRGVSRVLTGNGGQVSINSNNFLLKLLTGICFIEVEGWSAEKLQHTGALVAIATVTAGLKKEDVLFSQSAALFEIGNDCVSCSGLLDTACCIPLPSLNKTVGCYR